MSDQRHCYRDRPLSCTSLCAASRISSDEVSLMSTRSTIPTTAASIDISWFPIAERAALPKAHITISPVPAPSRSATTTMLRVGSLSRSYGCTIKNFTPSRSGVFFVDQTVPTTFARNIRVNPCLNFRKHLCGFTDVARGWRNYRFAVDVDLVAFLNRAPHIFFTYEVDS